MLPRVCRAVPAVRADPEHQYTKLRSGARVEPTELEGHRGRLQHHRERGVGHGGHVFVGDVVHRVSMERDPGIAYVRGRET